MPSSARSGVIAFTVSGLREKYLRRALDSWSRVRGVQGWHLLFCLEPPRPGVFPVAEFAGWVSRNFASAEVRINDQQLGCLRNTRHAMASAFELGAQFAVLAEEDVLVSTDVLEYLSWARDTYAADGQVAAVCAHSLRCDGGDAADVVRVSWFNPIIWGTWKDRWPDIEANWAASRGNSESWDHHLRGVFGSAGRQCVFPVRSRSLHTGQTSTLMPILLAEHFYQAALSSTFAADRAPQAYREIPFPGHLGLLV